MVKRDTLFLKLAILLMGLTVLALCTFLLPVLITDKNVGGYRPILMSMYITAIPFFVALYQALKLLDYIDRNKVFSELSIRALKRVKYCALIIGGLYTAGMPYIFYMAQLDDAPGIALIGFIVIGASFVIATAAAVFQRLLQNVIDIKSENDLTV